MVWMQWPPSMEGRLCGPSKSYSSFTISPKLDAEVVSVRPDKSEEKREKGSFPQPSVVRMLKTTVGLGS